MKSESHATAKNNGWPSCPQFGKSSGAMVGVWEVHTRLKSDREHAIFFEKHHMRLCGAFRPTKACWPPAGLLQGLMLAQLRGLGPQAASQQQAVALCQLAWAPKVAPKWANRVARVGEQEAA